MEFDTTTIASQKAAYDEGFLEGKATAEGGFLYMDMGIRNGDEGFTMDDVHYGQGYRDGYSSV